MPVARSNVGAAGESAVVAGATAVAVEVLCTISGTVSVRVSRVTKVRAVLRHGSCPLSD